MTVGLISIRAGYTSTPAVDTVPDAYTITSVTGATVSSSYTANTSAITGINAATNWTVSGNSSTAKINGTGAALTSGTLTVGQYLAVTQTSSASNSTETDAFINIGGVLATFAVTTAAAVSAGSEASDFMGPFLSSTATRALSANWSTWDNYWTTYEAGHYGNYVNPAFHTSGGVTGEINHQFGGATYGRASQYFCQADRYPASASDHYTKAQLIHADYVTTVSDPTYNYGMPEQWQEFKTAAIHAKKYGDAGSIKLLGMWGENSHANLVAAGYFGYFKGTNPASPFDDNNARWLAHGLEALCGAAYNSVPDQDYRGNGLTGNDWATYAGTLVDQAISHQEADGAWRWYKSTNYTESLPFQQAQIVEAFRIYDRVISTSKRAAIKGAIAKWVDFLEMTMLAADTNTYYYNENDGLDVNANILRSADDPNYDLQGWYINPHGYLWYLTGDQTYKDRLDRILGVATSGHASLVYQNPDGSRSGGVVGFWKQFSEMHIAAMSASWYYQATPLATPTTPRCTVFPVITGTATNGSTLTCSTGTWNNTPTSTTYQWYRYYGLNLASTHKPAEPIASATSSTYVLTGSDVGQKIFCRVYRSNASSDDVGFGAGKGVPIRTALTAQIA